MRRVLILMICVVTAVMTSRAQSLGEVMRALQERYEASRQGDRYSDGSPLITQLDWGSGLPAYPTDAQVASLGGGDVARIFEKIHDGLLWCELAYTPVKCDEYLADGGNDTTLNNQAKPYEVDDMIHRRGFLRKAATLINSFNGIRLINYEFTAAQTTIIPNVLPEVKRIARTSNPGFSYYFDLGISVSKSSGPDGDSSVSISDAKLRVFTTLPGKLMVYGYRDYYLNEEHVKAKSDFLTTHKFLKKVTSVNVSDAGNSFDFEPIAVFGPYDLFTGPGESKVYASTITLVYYPDFNYQVNIAEPWPSAGVGFGPRNYGDFLSAGKEMATIDFPGFGAFNAFQMTPYSSTFVGSPTFSGGTLIPCLGNGMKYQCASSGDGTEVFYGSNGVSVVKYEMMDWTTWIDYAYGYYSSTEYPTKVKLSVYAFSQLANPNDYSSVTGQYINQYTVTSDYQNTLDPLGSIMHVVVENENGNEKLDALRTVSTNSLVKLKMSFIGKSNFNTTIDFELPLGGTEAGIEIDSFNYCKLKNVSWLTLNGEVMCPNYPDEFTFDFTSPLLQGSTDYRQMRDEDGLLGWEIKNNGSIWSGDAFPRGFTGYLAGKQLTRSIELTNRTHAEVPPPNPPDGLSLLLAYPQLGTITTNLSGTAIAAPINYESTGEGYKYTSSDGTDAMFEVSSNNGKTMTRTYTHVNGTASIVVYDSAYRLGDACGKSTVDEGIPDNSSRPSSILHGTRTETEIGTFGSVISRKVSALGEMGSGVISSGRAGGLDPKGRPLSWTDELSGVVTQYTYESNGRVTSVTSADGATTTMAYDGLGRLKTMNTPDGAQTNVIYEGWKTTTTVQSAGQSVTTVKNTDPLGNLLSLTKSGACTPVSISVAMASDGSANWHRTTTTVGKTWHEIVTPDGAVLRSYGDPGSGIRGERHTYGVESAPQSVWAYPCLSHTVMSEDDFGSPIMASAVTTYTDAFGRLRVVKSFRADGSPRYVVYNYDSRDRLGSVNESGQLPVVYTYDEVGRVKTMTHGKEQSSYDYALTGSMLNTKSYVATDDGTLLVSDVTLNSATGDMTSKPFGNAAMGITRTVSAAARSVATSIPAIGFTATTTLNADRLGSSVTGSNNAGAFTATTSSAGLFGATTRGSNISGVSATTVTTPVPAAAGVDIVNTVAGLSSSAQIRPDSFNSTSYTGATTSATYNAASHNTTVSGSAIPGYSVKDTITQTGVTSNLVTTRAAGTANTTTTDRFDGTSTKRYNDGRGPLSRYDEASHTQTTTLADGSTIAMQYDDYGAMVSFTESGMPGVTITRDKLSRMKTLTDATGSSSFEYDAHGNPTSESHSGGLLDGVTIAYSVDSTPLERPAGLTLVAPSQASAYATAITYASATDGRVGQVTGLDGVTAQYDYIPDNGASKNRLKSVQLLKNGTIVSNRAYGYDGLGRLTSLVTTKDGGASTLFARTFSFGAGADADRRVSSTINDNYDLGGEPGLTWQYAYTQQGGLSRAVLSRSGNQIPGGYLTYNHDSLGNRTGAAATVRGEAANAIAETPDRLDALNSFVEPGLIGVSGTVPSGLVPTVYSWKPDAAHVRLGAWDSAGTAAAGSDAIAEYAALLDPGAWRPSLKWPAITAPADAVLVTVSLPGRADMTIVVNPGQQPGVELALSGYHGTIGGRARVRISAAPATSGRVPLPQVIWERRAD